MTSAGFPHWPDLGERLTDDMSDRALMGYPERFVPDAGPWPTRGVVREMAAETPERLARLAEDATVESARRLAAGRLLGLTGDPRVEPNAPRMVDVPGGVVAIGLEASEVDGVLRTYRGLGLDRRWILKETPLHRVELRPYRIGRYLVTNAEYRRFLEATGHPELPTSWPFGRYPAERSNVPVYTVSGESAMRYAAWLADTTGRRFRLPSEAEWEHAAAGPDRLEFPWGGEFEPGRANTAEAGLLDATPIGVFPAGASAFGALDMAGNVEEYVNDLYRPYPGGPDVVDDLSRVVGRHHVARGGSFTRFRDLARTRRRHGRYPRDIYVMGFRLAEDRS